jgi:sterol O-acyltransferase
MTALKQYFTAVEKEKQLTPNGKEPRLPRKVLKTPFAPRPSLLDFESLHESKNSMRGFFTLFWVTVSIAVMNISYQHFVKNGTFLSLRLASELTNDIADLFMYITLIIALIF